MNQPKLKPPQTSAPSSLFFMKEQFDRLTFRERYVLLGYEEFREGTTLCVKSNAETLPIWNKVKPEG
jgi:hypothetical protein